MHATRDTLASNDCKRIEPRISVVIPALNEAQELPGCLHQLTNQTLKAFELIVVDNGSTDDTSKVAESGCARVVREPRSGAAYARQSGFLAATAPIIASTDADARVPERWLEDIVQIFDQTPDVLAVFGPFRFIRGTAPNALTNSLLPLLSLLQLLSSSAANAWGYPFFAGSNFAVRREAFDRVGGFFDETTGVAYSTWEDVYLGRKLQRIGPVVYRRDVVVDVSARCMGSLHRKFYESARKAITLSRSKSKL